MALLAVNRFGQRAACFADRLSQGDHVVRGSSALGICARCGNKRVGEAVVGPFPGEANAPGLEFGHEAGVALNWPSVKKGVPELSSPVP